MTSEDSDLSDDSDSSWSEIDEVAETLADSEQWVKCIEYCSVGATPTEAVSKIIAIQRLCQATDADYPGDNHGETGWIFANNHREESLTVSFETPVFINYVHIYENLNPGSIVKLELMNPKTNKFWPMWQLKSPVEKQPVTHRIFKPLLRRYRLLTATIRLTLDPRYTDRVGIQAIKLCGSNIFDTSVDRLPLAKAMTKLHQQALANLNTDVQFLVHDQRISAHRNILSCRSEYFRALLSSNFIERTQKEPIVLTDIDQETFTAILRFIYTGTYHSNPSYDLSLRCMIYANRINFLTAKDVAIEQLCCYLRSNHQAIVPTYSLIKPLSPAFDLLLNYIYELCSEHLHEICREKEFVDLDKDLMVDLICQSARRRDDREKAKLNASVAALFDPEEAEDEDDVDE